MIARLPLRAVLGPFVPAFVVAAFASPVAAEVKQASPASLSVTHTLAVAASPTAVWDALPKVGRWWNGDHSWSHSAANLSLDLQAGGCFCERWAEGSVEHGRVVMAMPPRVLRVSATLGPLLELAVSGVLTFTIAKADGGATLTVSYRVSGDDSHALDKIAVGVDAVIGEQAARLKKFVETGAPQ